MWFRSPHQLGLTVDAWGPGLLLLAEAPNAPVPHGARDGDPDDRTATTIDGSACRRLAGAVGGALRATRAS